MRKETTGFVMILLLLCMLFVAGCAKNQALPSAETVEAPPAIAPQPQPVEPLPPAVSQVEKVEVPPIELERIHFAFDRYSLSAESLVTLAQDAKILIANPDVKVKIEGHCDSRGSDEYNLALGERRAQATMDYLVSLGVKPEQLQIISFGEESPLDPANTETAWAENRRAEFRKLD